MPKRVLIVLLLLLAACSQPPGPERSTFRCVGNWFIPPAFHGNTWAQGGEGSHEGFIYEPLFFYFPQSDRLVPRLALSWEESEDGRVLTLRLRDGVVWHDGQPFTAHDVKAHLLARFLVGWLDNVTELVVEDRLTLRYVAKKPLSLLEKRMLLMLQMKTPAHRFEEWTGPAEQLLERAKPLPSGFLPPRFQPLFKEIQEEKNRLVQGLYRFHPPVPIGTGAYRLVSVTASDLELVRFEEYWSADEVKIDRVHLTTGGGQDILLALLVSGEVDVAQVQAAEDLTERIKELNPNLRLVTVPRYSELGVVVNLKRHPTSSPALRRSLAHLLDRDSLRRIAAFHAAPSDDYHIPLVPRAREKWLRPEALESLVRYERSAEKAESVLQREGWRRGEGGAWLDPAGEPVTLEILANASGGETVLAAESLARQLHHFGLPARVRMMDYALFVDRLENQEFDLAVYTGSTYGAHAHPFEAVELHLGSEGFLAKVSGMRRKLAGPDGRIVDLQKQVAVVATALDEETVRRAVEKLIWIANRQLSFISLYEEKLPLFISEGERVKGWPPPESELWSGVQMGVEACWGYLLSTGVLMPSDS